MAERKMFAVGLQVPGNAAEHVSFKSDRSLFDADVILFKPTFVDYQSYDWYAGKSLISASDSQALLRDCGHWRSEIKAAVDSGKIIFVFLAKPGEVYVHTGEKTFSGTGRSRVTTDVVAPATTYQSLPVTFTSITPKGGQEIAVRGDLGALSEYWHEFAAHSAYEVYFESTQVTPLFTTKKGEKVVGGLVRTKAGGALVLLPPVRWDESQLTYTRGKQTFWNKQGVVLGQRLVHALSGATEALRQRSDHTPPPEWATGSIYLTQRESSLAEEVDGLDQKIAKISARRAELTVQLQEAGSLRGLLYETGKPLEKAVLEALTLLGFSVQTVQEGASAFDAVFTSTEGRFLGEVEGKDRKAVNIDKMSQLERNLQEDFARDEVHEFAKGVLFGNAFRFDPPAERPDFFTEKCVKAATRLKAALVRTPDLFVCAKHLLDHPDPDYARACREALLGAEGTPVAFPTVPTRQGEGAPQA